MSLASCACYILVETYKRKFLISFFYLYVKILLRENNIIAAGVA